MLLHTVTISKNLRISGFRRLSLPLSTGVVGLAAVFFFIANVRAQSHEPPLLVMISVDGMRPDYITEADAHGAKVPNLRRFLKEGSYAEGVVGVVPTVTYPSHTTLVTGVWPAEHGITDNNTFDPGLPIESWYWYASDIRVRTLWDAAHQAGLVTASVSWPVTVDAQSIDYLIPEYWRTRTPEDHRLMESISRPAGWLAKAEEKL